MLVGVHAPGHRSPLAGRRGCDATFVDDHDGNVPTCFELATRLASGSSNSGTMFELEVITAVVLGGTSLMGGRGSIIGSAIGALTLGIISNGLVLLRVDVYWVPIVQA